MERRGSERSRRRSKKRRKKQRKVRKGRSREKEKEEEGYAGEDGVRGEQSHLEVRVGRLDSNTFPL